MMLYCNLKVEKKERIPKELIVAFGICFLCLIFWFQVVHGIDPMQNWQTV